MYRGLSELSNFNTTETNREKNSIDLNIQIDAACPDQMRTSCWVDDGQWCCEVETMSGTCDNCGTQNTGIPRTGRTYNCWLCVDVSPIRRVENPEISYGSCEYHRLVREWVCH